MPAYKDKDFLIFYASRDVNGVMWCPDCRNVEEIVSNQLSKHFGSAGEDKYHIVYVGDRATWKTPENEFRKQPWNIQSIPTIVHYKEGSEVSRLVENEILEANRLDNFLASK